MHVLHFMNPQLAKLHQLLMENECGLLPHPDLVTYNFFKRTKNIY